MQLQNALVTAATPPLSSNSDRGDTVSARSEPVDGETGGLCGDSGSDGEDKGRGRSVSTDNNWSSADSDESGIKSEGMGEKAVDTMSEVCFLAPSVASCVHVVGCWWWLIASKEYDDNDIRHNGLVRSW